MTNTRFIETENEFADKNLSKRNEEEYAKVSLPHMIKIDPQGVYQDIDNELLERIRNQKVDEAFAKKFTCQ